MTMIVFGRVMYCWWHSGKQCEHTYVIQLGRLAVHVARIAASPAVVTAARLKMSA